jgi:hypothetical protein
MSEQACWRIADHADPAWRHWDEGFLVHHALSNDTHHLSMIAGQVLVHLAAAGVQHEAAVAESLDLDGSQLEAILDALRRLELVTRC